MTLKMVKPKTEVVQQTYHAKPNIHNIWDQPIRVKRFAGWVALPMAIAATAMGLYNRKQLEALRDELFGVKGNVKRLFRISQDLTMGLQQVDKSMDMIRSTIILLTASNPAIVDARMTRIENQLRHRVERSIHAVQSAIHGRLAIDYLDPKSVSDMFKQVKIKANELGCDLLMEYHTDLFQVESSLLFDGQEGHLIIHLPMAPKEGQLRLFRLHPFPLPLFDDKYLIPDVKNDVIAISSTDSRLNIQLAAVELLSCHRMGSLFLCDNFGVLSRRFNTTCLGSLYYSLFEQAEKVCKFKVVPAEEQVYQIHKGEFIVYSPTPVTVNIKCRNGTASEKHLKRGSQKFDLSKGCSAELSLHKIIADYSTDLGSSIKVFDWEWDSVNFMDGRDKEISAAIEKLHSIKILTPELSELQYIASLDHGEKWADGGGRFIAGFAISSLTVGCFVTAVCCYCWCQRFRCCRGDQAKDRRGQGRRKSSRHQQVRHRRRSASCGLLCCCRDREREDSQVRWSRGHHTEGEESEDAITIESRRYPGTSEADEDRLQQDLRKAEAKVDERLNSMNVKN